MSEPAQNVKTIAQFMQNWTLQLLIDLHDQFLLFPFKEKSRFSRFPPKKVW